MRNHVSRDRSFHYRFSVRSPFYPSTTAIAQLRPRGFPNVLPSSLNSLQSSFVDAPIKEMLNIERYQTPISHRSNTINKAPHLLLRQICFELQASLKTAVLHDSRRDLRAFEAVRSIQNALVPKLLMQEALTAESLSHYAPLWLF